MKILHLMLSSFYIDGYNYQENVLPKMNKLDGNEVKIIASTVTYINNKTPGFLEPKKYINEDGIEVIRVPYVKYLPRFLNTKIRIYKDLKENIEKFDPDIIFFHGLGGYALISVSKYIKTHPNVRLYADCHGDSSNTATTWLSKNILHKCINRSIVKCSLPFIEKILCISYEAMVLAKKLYDLPDDSLELFPLGGIIPEENERKRIRRKIRNEFDLGDENILIIHTGKLDKKKRTIDLLKAFIECDEKKLRLFIVGSLLDDIANDVRYLVNKDKRISFIGWKNGDELLSLLCASDLYIQPGGQSATMQNAACCGNALALYPHKSHKMLMGETVFYIDTVESIRRLLEEISANPEVLEKKRRASFELAKKELDYKELAKRIYV